MSDRSFKIFGLLCLVIILLAIDLIAAFAVIQDRNHTIAADKAAISGLAATNQSLQTALANKSTEFTVWNSCGGPCEMNASQVRAGGAPDTFDTIISFTSTIPVTVHFITLEGWAQFSTCSFKISCVSPKNFDVSVGPTTSLTDYVFKDAEGCASYVVVFQASAAGVITPNERVRYNPASMATGACA